MLPKLNNEIPQICNSLDLTQKNIFLTSTDIMNDILSLQKELESFNQKYNTLKENLDSSQMNKKKMNQIQKLHIMKIKEKKQKMKYYLLFKKWKNYFQLLIIKI